MVRSNRRATVAQTAEEINAGSDRKVSEYTVHHSLLCMGLHSCRPVRVPMLTPVHCRKHQQWAREHQNWTTDQWKMVVWSDESCFLLCHVDGQDVLDKQVRSMEAPPRNLQDLKHLLLTSWCQIPQHTFRGLVESMPQRVGAVLAAKDVTLACIQNLKPSACARPARHQTADDQN